MRTFPSGARTFTWSTAAALLIALLPAVAAAHLAGSYQAFIDNPREAAQTLEAEIDGLTAELADLENAASEALAAYEASRERAVAAVRFYDAAVTGLTLHSIFGSGDLVELLAGLRALARAAERDLATLETYRALREDSLRTAAELEARQAALASRQALVPLFLRADEERRAFRVSHPDPAQAEAALLAEWQRQAPLALALLQHVRERLADGAALFREDPGGDRFVLTVDRLLDRLHPFPAEVAAQVDRLDVVILADHVYWALESGGAQTVLITWFEPLNRNRLRLTFEVILHRGLPVAADQVALINAFLPTEIDVSGLGVDARDVRHEDGLVTLPPADG
ncbi:MAG TPA: hypothetical protein VF282_03545 [Bacillota bacterium]